MQASKGDTCFVCHDHFRPRPVAYAGSPLGGIRAAGGAFNGTATLQSVSNSRQIVVSGLPANFALKARDNIEIRKTANINAKSLHVIQSDVTASAGGIATIAIEYPLNSEFTSANSSVNFEKPACVMMLDQGASLRRWHGSRQASFTASERFIS
jgi:hypothetical protein